MTVWVAVAAAMAAQGAHGKRFTNLNLRDGLSQMSVMKIYQDSKGFMWFGTRNGLNKYDGVGMTVYRGTATDGINGLAGCQISSILEDGHKNMWVGTDIGLNRIDLTTGKITSYSGAKHPWVNGGVRWLFIDSRGHLWVGAGRGLFLFEPNSEISQPVTLNGRLSGEAVTVVTENKAGQLLIGTEHKGVFVCDSTMKLLRHFDTTNKLPANNISDILPDLNGAGMWISTSPDGGLVHLNARTGETRLYNSANSALSTDNIRCLTRNGENIFVGTFDGLYVIDTETGELSPHSRADGGRGNLSHFSIFSLCVDRGGGLWVGTYSGGADYLSPYNNRFTFHEPSDASGVMPGVHGPAVDMADGNLYVATEGGGLLVHDGVTDRSHYYLFNTASHPYYSYNIIKSMLRDGNEILCGTTEGTIYAFNPLTRSFALKYKLPQRASVYSMVRGSDGNLWVATSKPTMGMVRIAPDGKMTENLESADTLWNPGSARCLMELRPGVFLIGTRNNGMFKYDAHRRSYVPYVASDADNALKSNYVTSLMRDRSGRIWVSTFGGGLCQFDPSRGIVKRVGKAQGLADEDICMAVEDRNGTLWLSATNCIMSYNPANGAVHNYLVGNDIGSQEFSPHSGTMMANGEICLSTGKGFVTFDPAKLALNSYRPPVVFTGLAIGHEKVEPGQGSVLTTDIDDTPGITLAYNQNNISISYAALNFVHPDQNSYAIRLVGYDDTWHEVGNRNSAYYTNLKPGKYVFEVKAANNDGVCSDEVRSLEITVRPPVWATWYAYLLYAVLFFGTCFLIMYYITKKKGLEQKLHFKQLEQERSEEFHRTKLQMFTNFSHELRTPLTLIISPLEELIHRTDFNGAVKNKLNLIYNNSQRMLILINQLMDLRKTQAGKMKLNISRDDLCSFLQEMYCAFNQLADGKQVTFEYHSDEERIPAWFDKSLCDKVIFNLLSNAFKFTRPSDRITMSVSRLTAASASAEGLRLPAPLTEGVNYVHLTVADTGRGIPEGELENIFAPFYQVEGSQPKESAGTGIGLSLTKSIVELHHGMIWAEHGQGRGAVFHVVLPIDRSVYSDDEIDRAAADRVVVDVIPSEAPETLNLDRRYTVLLAEDHEEVRAYVKECLSPYFDVIEAADGETAFDLTVEKYPDIVVSDVMMPGRNGLELCSMIKEDLRTEHIPVVLMTARCMVMHIKEGFSCGADDYIIKPFSMDVLIYRIRNILASREKLKKLYGKKFSLESMGIKVVSAEDKFTQKFFDVIEKNIANPDLNIDMICREVGLSRTNLYRKLKAITDLSPVELIRNKRLEVAAQLLRQTDYTVSEISTQVGFNSHAYFTQCFKAAYGCSPSEFVEGRKEE